MEDHEQLGVPQFHGPLRSIVSGSPEQGNLPGGTGSATQKRSIKTFIKRFKWFHLLAPCIIIGLLVAVIAVSVYFGSEYSAEKSNTEEEGNCHSSPNRVKLNNIQDPDFVALIVFFWPWSPVMENTSSPMYEEAISKAEYWVTKIFQTSSLSSCITSAATEMINLGGNMLVQFKLYVSCDSAIEIEVNRAYIEGHLLLQRTQDRSCMVNISKNIYLMKLRKNISLTDTVIASNISNTICGQSQLYPIPKIVGGRPVNRGQYPWVVKLERNDGKVCGGTIWDYNHILTAAQCIDNRTGQFDLLLTKVLAGKWETSISSRNEQYRRIASARIHTGFDLGTAANDVALVKLNEPLNPTTLVMKVCHPDANTQFPKRGIVAGWGTTKAGLRKSPEVQQSVEVVMLSQSNCLKLLRLSNIEDEPKNGTLCTIDDDLEEKDNYQMEGDSGGPLFANLGSGGVERYTIFGIVSHGLVCGRSPAVYASVQYYLDWIQNTIRHWK